MALREWKGWWLWVGDDREIALPGGTLAAGEILRAVPHRIQTMLDGPSSPAAAGDEGMARLMAAGEPGRSFGSLAGLIDRIPAIERQLA